MSRQWVGELKMPYEEALEYLIKWDKAVESRGDSPQFSDARKALATAILAVEKQLPRKPKTVRAYSTNYKCCPNCGSVCYDPDWDTHIAKKYWHEKCTSCGQKFTPLGEYIGDWEDET